MFRSESVGWSGNVNSHFWDTEEAALSATTMAVNLGFARAVKIYDEDDNLIFTKEA